MASPLRQSYYGAPPPAFDGSDADHYGSAPPTSPHRLSSGPLAGPPSPYADHRGSFDQAYRPPSVTHGAYSDPFAGRPASPVPRSPLAAAAAAAYTRSATATDPFLSGRSPTSSFEQPRRDSMSYYPRNSDYPPVQPLPYHNGGYAPSPAQPGFNPHYGAPRPSVDDMSYHNEADTWGIPPSSSSSTSLARERYMARKEAEAAAAGESTGLVSKEGGPYGYANAGRPRGRRAAAESWILRRKWWLLAVLAAIALIGIVAGVAVSHVQKNTAAASNGVNGVVQVIDNDPSNFVKDPRLHNSFYGMCYTPLNSQYPACGDTLNEVIEDVQLLSQLTTRIRLYGADCNVTALVLDAIQRTKTNVTVFPAVWINGDDSIYTRGADAVIAAIQAFGPDHVDGITVGNEYMLNGGTIEYLAAKMTDMRARLAALNLPKTIPVGTADAGSMVTLAMAQASDYVMSNVHPWFGGVPVDQAAGWTWDYFNTNTPAVALTAPNKPAVYIAETGWPTGANETAFATYQGAVAGVPELNTFLSTFVCQANANGTTAEAFWFEAFDEGWKVIFGGVEEHWGLFNGNKTLKDGVVIPNCSSP